MLGRASSTRRFFGNVLVQAKQPRLWRSSSGNVAHNAGKWFM